MKREYHQQLNSMHHVKTFMFLSLFFFIGMWGLQAYNYLIFHSFTEIFGVVVAFGIFSLAWNSRFLGPNYYLIFIGIAYLFVGSLDLLHTVAYKGMAIFIGFDANLPTQLWISARYMESLSLLIAPFFMGGKLKINMIFSCYTAVFVCLLLSIFYWQVFPDCFIEGTGLTSFKKISESVICMIFAVSLLVLLKKRAKFDRNMLFLIIASILLTIFSELAFIFYTSVYGFSNFIGHYFKILSFYLIYKAIIETGFTQPVGLIFRDLKNAENDLKKAKKDLEAKVKIRTIQLTKINKILKRKFTEHKQAEKKIMAYQKRLKVLALSLTIAEEKERRNLAEDLHDNISQKLAFLRIQIAKARKYSPAGKLEDILEEISHLILGSIQDIKFLASNLSSPLLKEIGLAAATSNWLEEQVYQKHGIRTEFIDKSEAFFFDDNLKTILFRNVRELLTNVIKHAKADKVTVTLETMARVFTISIEDDGIGVKSGAESMMVSCKTGFGLFSIRERMEDFGGALEIISRPGNGYRAILSIPLDKDYMKKRT
jgi:signal transduction histidine kinase